MNILHDFYSFKFKKFWSNEQMNTNFTIPDLLMCVTTQIVLWDSNSFLRSPLTTRSQQLVIWEWFFLIPGLIPIHIYNGSSVQCTITDSDVSDTIRCDTGNYTQSNGMSVLIIWKISTFRRKRYSVHSIRARIYAILFKSLKNDNILLNPGTVIRMYTFFSRRFSISKLRKN